MDLTQHNTNLQNDDVCPLDWPQQLRSAPELDARLPCAWDPQQLSWSWARSSKMIMSMSWSQQLVYSWTQSLRIWSSKLIGEWMEQAYQKTYVRPRTSAFNAGTVVITHCKWLLCKTNHLKYKYSEREREDLVVVQELSDGIFSAKYSRSIQSQNRCREVRERERGQKK